jgi:hypothetical protein
MIHAESLKIDTDEGRYMLLVETDDCLHRFDIHGLVLDFYDEVRRELLPYVVEAEAARVTVPQLVTNRPVSVEDAIEAGYALDDPKSPGYHDRMVD